MEIPSIGKMAMAVSAAQVRAARALLGWSQSDLATAASLSRPTIERAETSGASATTFTAMQAALEKAGVIFLDENGDGPGVRLRKRRRGKQVADPSAENDE
jgi:transcriptional regulator with XRE-family HTH domain